MNMTTINRKLIQVSTPAGEPGFLGAGHVARPVIQRSFRESDPFIMLMDDMLDKKDNIPVGGPHPHAGFETVTLILEGELGNSGHTMKAGDFELMTAGSGIIHTETIDKKASIRILQMWLNLPKKYRGAIPRIQKMPVEHVPVFSENGVDIKLYSGSLAGITSPVQNYVPLILADITLKPRITTAQLIPANYNAFLYVLEGSVEIGQEKNVLQKDQVGWLDLHQEDNQSELLFTTDNDGVRLVLYAAKPTGESIVSHGPFIADSSEDIARLYREYRQGNMKHISTVPEGQTFSL
jgi:quercetin 2,3-dioxygenase